MQRRELERKISVARMKLVEDNPFFGHIALRLDVELTDSIDTAATDGKKIYFNPSFASKLSPAELEFVIAHEVLHIGLKHFGRCGNRDKHVWNVACDFAVNSILVKNKIGKKPQDALYDPEFENLPAEQIYNLLLIRDPTGCRDLSTLDEHPDELDPENEEWADEIISESAVMTRGLPQVPEYVLEEMLEKIEKPKIDWRSALARLIKAHVVPFNFSYIRPSKKSFAYEQYVLPGIEKIPSLIVVAVDTSGSISTEQLQRFFAELNGILREIECDVLLIQCDSKVRKVQRFKGGRISPGINVKGRGGTDFRPVFNYIKEQKLNPDLLIYFTDAQGTFPEKKPSYPVLWVISGSNEKPPFGKVIYMD